MGVRTAIGEKIVVWASERTGGGRERPAANGRAGRWRTNRRAGERTDGRSDGQAGERRLPTRPTRPTRLKEYGEKKVRFYTTFRSAIVGRLSSSGKGY